jgi:hypothetical protein
MKLIFCHALPLREGKIMQPRLWLLSKFKKNMHFGAALALAPAREMMRLLVALATTMQYWLEAMFSPHFIFLVAH